MKKQRVKGAHYTIDFFGCDPYQINSMEFWQLVLPQAAKDARMDVLHSYFHKFDPQGITGFLLLSSSHISFHSWPEYSYVACDVFSCSCDEETYKAVECLKRMVEHKRAEVHKIKRGYVVMDFLPVPIYSTGKKENIKINKKIAETTSAFQNIIVVDTAPFGKTMVIDGIVQTSEKDHELYDRSILDKLKIEDKKILILGGGDGYVAQTAISINPNVEIYLIDLDLEVVNFAKNYLDQKIFEHPQIHLSIGDAVAHMKALISNGKNDFDGIISDLTDNPIGSGKTRKNHDLFYKEIFSLSHQLLKPEGWISVQAGASKTIKKYIDSAKMLTKLMEKEFGNVSRKDVFVPSFGENNAFLYSVNKK